MPQVTEPSRFHRWQDVAAEHILPAPTTSQNPEVGCHLPLELTDALFGLFSLVDGPVVQTPAAITYPHAAWPLLSTPARQKLISVVSLGVPGTQGMGPLVTRGVL